MNNFYKTNLKIISKNKKNPLPNLKQFKYLSFFLNIKEKILLRLLIVLVLISSFYFIFRGYEHIRNRPDFGGAFVEGIIGEMQYLNPVLAYSNNVDIDIDKLIYNSLFEYNERKLSPSLVSDYTISEDQKTYNLKIRKDIKWHDGESLNADDVVYTINTIKDQNYKSPLYLNLKNVIVEKVDSYELKITLDQPYSPFLSTLTFGILPKHIWQDIPFGQFSLSEFNLKPIGTGPYKFKSISKSKEGFIKSYTLEENIEYFKGKPYIKEVTFLFLNDPQEALETIQDKKIDNINYLPYNETKDNIKDKQSLTLNYLYLPQYTAIFINDSNNPILSNKNIKKALYIGTDKGEIKNLIFDGKSETVNSIFLKNMLGYNPDYDYVKFNPSEAVGILETEGWKRNSETNIMEKDGKPLEITLTLVNDSDSKAVGNLLQKQWNRLGIKLNLQLVQNDTIKDDVLKPRNYEMLLYGQILGQDSDPYPFWHSSQVDNPGLNLSSYKNSTVDKEIEKARKTNIKEDREKSYFIVNEEMQNDIPAILLYNKPYVYVTSDKIKTFIQKNIVSPSDRFNQIEKWYIKTKKDLFN